MAEPLRVQPTEADAAAIFPRQRILLRLAAAFSYRDFRVLWFGAFTSTTGTWMQKVAQSWLVLTITGSPFYLGLDVFLGELPIMLLTLLGGVIADRHDRRYVLIGSQFVQMTSALTLAALVFWDAQLDGEINGDVLHIWHILALSFVSGCGQAFGGPSYQSLIPSLVPKDHLPNAIALNSIQFNLARVIGPLLAGLTLATLGTAACFTINGLSFLVVIVALLSLHVRHVAPTIRQRILEEMRSGISYVRHEGAMVALIVLAFATTFLGLPLLTLLPVFVQDVFNQDVARYSEMMAFSGAGAVVGALIIAWFGRFRHMGLVLLLVQVVFGVLVVAFATSRLIWLSQVLLFFAGAALIMVFSLITSLVQLIAPNEMRGRVMSIYMVAFRGGMPLGSLLGGYVASVASAPIVLAVNGVLLSAVAWHFLVKSHGVREL